MKPIFASLSKPSFSLPPLTSPRPFLFSLLSLFFLPSSLSSHHHSSTISLSLSSDYVTSLALLLSPSAPSDFCLALSKVLPRHSTPSWPPVLPKPPT
ncbi:uncharacterized protein BDW47DRAFT_106653 [Aspergillus candidus]|uniref:Uncharacterized protein n=1 Tax=Aspergillus candidus TaxID=41067 RepID=A0A2I2FAQ5_ASPCN|nr:hypothetical protein BDW47DRAFT_106653 [Aspergillus candidus]PLB37702.1 hypothetical protein BDW47DRAFT_106653 [Aspergillus candidus]